MRNWRFVWTEEQEKILLDHIQNKGDDKELVNNKILPFSLNAIRKKKSRLLCGVKRKFTLKYSSEVKKLFKDFLLKNWTNNTPDDLVVMWNAKYNVKTNRRKVIQYLGLLKVKVSYVQVLKIKQYKKLLNDQKYEKAREYKIKMFEQRLKRGLDLWTGLKLDPSIDPMEGVFIDGKPAKSDAYDELDF